MELFSDNDIATEILSRLPVESLVAFKCTAKRWNRFVSDPLFLRIHHQRSKRNTGLFLQHRVSDTDPMFETIDLLTPTTTGYKLNYKLLDFLPEKVVVLSSCEGILCCRSWIDRKSRERQRKTNIYICNPITRLWVKVKTNVYDYRYNLLPGFAFYPSSGEDSVFKLVNVIENYNFSYSFEIYSSDTKKWKTSNEVCNTTQRRVSADGNYPTTVIFSNGWLHWLTTDYVIVAFHVEKELSKVIKFPCVPRFQISTDDFGICNWGESEGHLHYVHAYGPELQVWVLKNYEEEPAWELKYDLNMARFCDQHSSLQKYNKNWLEVLTFHEDVLYIRPWDSGGILISYDFRTKTLIDHGEIVRQSAENPNSTVPFPFYYDQLLPIVVPFSASLLPLQELLPFGERHSKKIKKKQKRKELLREILLTILYVCDPKAFKAAMQ